MKKCGICKREVSGLWRSEKKDKQTGEIIQEGCCKNCRSKTPIKSKASSKEDKQFKKDLNVFFASQALAFPERCENCNRHLDMSSAFAKRSQTCHILPKSKNSGFPSVATHIQNKVFMCCYDGCQGHGRYDNGDAETRKNMVVYGIALERFRSFENELTTKEKVKAYKYLGLDDTKI